MIRSLVSLFLLCSLVLCREVCHAQKQRDKHRTSIPPIAWLLGVQVGYNGQDALARRLGPGRIATGGHPNSRQLWCIRSPKSEIVTDGFNMNREGYVIESLEWSLPDASRPQEFAVPYAKSLPRGSGWMGIITPGMTQREVTRLLAKRMPPPKKQGDTWRWEAKGYYRLQNDVYYLWIAVLVFRHGYLISISVDAEYKYAE